MKEISVLGITAYCDSYICDESFFYFLSFSARPMIAKAIGAALVARRDVYTDRFVLNRPSYDIKILTHNADGLCHKVLYCPELFKGTHPFYRIVIGKDMDTAFHWVDSMTTTPLKKQWKQWLWENVLEIQQLSSYGTLGTRKLDKAYMLRFSGNDNIDELVLNAIEAGELS